MPKVLSAEAVAAFRQRLCAVAEAQFAAHGLDGVSMRQIARALGVSAMTPYHYFKDKEEMLTAVRAAAFDRFSDCMEAARQAAREAGGVVADGSVDEAYMRFATTETAAYRLMFDLSQPHEEDYPDLQRATGRAHAVTRAHVEDLVQAGIIAGDPGMLSAVFWSMLHGIVVLQLAGKFPPSIDPVALRHIALRALSTGFGFDPDRVTHTSLSMPQGGAINIEPEAACMCNQL
jgi:AcrR family transcriptional regulator